MLEDGGTGMLVVGEAGSFAGPGLSGADVVVVAGDEALDEVGAVAEEGMQAILLLSRDDRSVPMLHALAPSGWGIVPPDAPVEELSAAVASVARGLVILSRTLAERLLSGTATLEELDEPLTAREREVLDLFGTGALEQDDRTGAEHQRTYRQVPRLQRLREAGSVEPYRSAEPRRAARAHLPVAD